MSSSEPRPDAGRRVLVVLAHPDDPEYFCGGTVARWASEGRAITYCLVTSGDKGSDDVGTDVQALARRREQEQREAAAVLGVESVEFMGRADGTLEPDLALRRDIARVIRRVRPQTVITCDPTMLFPRRIRINHADHRAVGLATIDAVYPAAGSGTYFPEMLQEGLQPHKVREVYVAGTREPNTSVDITEHVERKLEALRRHQSQISDFESVAQWVRERLRDPASPPETPRYIEQFLRLEPFD